MSLVIDQLELARYQKSDATISIQEIDESFFLRISGGYWNWRTLFDRDSQAGILQHPDCVLAELAKPKTPRSTPGFFIQCARQNSVVGAAVLVPKNLSGEKRFGPTLCLKGYFLAGGRLLGSQIEADQLALLSGIRQCLDTARADFVLIENIDDTDPTFALLNRPEHAQVLKLFTPAPFQLHHKIALPDDLETYLRKFSSKTRNTLKRKQKQFGDCRLERITEVDQVPDFLARAHEISKHSWQSDLFGLRIANDAAELQLYTTLALERAMRSYLLWKNDNPVSFCLGTQFNGVFNYEEVAYDRRFAESSPGQMLVMRMIEDLISYQRPAVFDFGFGDAEYKRQFANVTTASGNVWLLRPGLKSAVIEHYFRGHQWLTRSAREVLARTGLLQRFKRWVRRHHEPEAPSHIAEA